MGGRCHVAKELNTRLSNLQRDMGGTNHLSYQLKSLAERAIHLEALLQGMELDLSRGKTVPLGNYVQGINTLIGLMKTLGLERQAKDLSLGEYLSQQKEQDND